MATNQHHKCRAIETEIVSNCTECHNLTEAYCTQENERVEKEMAQASTQLVLDKSKNVVSHGDICVGITGNGLLEKAFVNVICDGFIITMRFDQQHGDKAPNPTISYETYMFAPRLSGAPDLLDLSTLSDKVPRIDLDIPDEGGQIQ